MSVELTPIVRLVITLVIMLVAVPIAVVLARIGAKHRDERAERRLAQGLPPCPRPADK